MSPSSDLLEFLRGWEGPIHLSPREDPASPGTWDIGYGHVCSRDHPRVTEQWCEDRLELDVDAFAQIVNDAVAATVTLAQHEFDALVSFCYNVGPGKPGAKDGLVWLKNGNHSTLLRMVNALDFDAAALEFARWNRAGGVVVRGLTKRRAAEQAMFVNADYSKRP